MTLVKKYNEKLLRNGYDLLTKENVSWPGNFTIKMKTKMYKQLIEHFSQREEFECCTKLTDSMNKLK